MSVYVCHICGAIYYDKPPSCMAAHAVHQRAVAYWTRKKEEAQQALDKATKELEAIQDKR